VYCKIPQVSWSGYAFQRSDLYPVQSKGIVSQLTTFIDVLQPDNHTPLLIKTGRKISVHSLTGGLMESFFQIGEVTLEGLVSPGELLCFSHLVTLVCKALYTEVWTKQQLEQFEYEIREYRSEFINLYGCVEETVRGESMLIISSLLEKHF